MKNEKFYNCAETLHNGSLTLQKNHELTVF